MNSRKCFLKCASILHRRFRKYGLFKTRNVEDFPEVFISPQESYKHTIRYTFTIDRGDNKKCKLFLDRTPWIQEDLFLKCDICPREESTNREPEQEPPFKKTFATLEMLASRTCKLEEEDDDDSLSIHSSFTSFGSDDHVLPMDGDTEVEEIMESIGPTTADQSECTPKVYVMEPSPLPPYLTGKWPRNPNEPQVPKEIPERRICSKEESVHLKPAKTLAQKQVLPTKKLQLPQEKKREKVKEIKVKTYTPIKIGVMDKIDEDKLKTRMDPGINISDAVANLDESVSSFESNMSAKNPVLGRSGNWNTLWMETVEKLPWYSRKLHKSCKPSCVKSMGLLFQLINFPQQFYNFNQTHDEIVEMINLQNQFMKSVANSIEYTPGELTLY